MVPGVGAVVGRESPLARPEVWIWGRVALFGVAFRTAFAPPAVSLGLVGAPALLSLLTPGLRSLELVLDRIVVVVGLAGGLMVLFGTYNYRK